MTPSARTAGRRRTPAPATADTVARLFQRRFGAAPAGVWSAPGRANIIGEHTDYSGGLVLPFAIDMRAFVAIGPRTQDFMVVSAQRRGAPRRYRNDDISPESGAITGWQRYVLGVVWALRQEGYDVPPLNIALSSTVAAGAGLSSSAAVECAVTLAISDFLGLGLDADRPRLARIARKAENDFVGVPVGLMDQMASAASQAGHALFFDVGAETIEHIPFDPDAADVAVVIIDTRAHHQLADGEYAARHRDTALLTALLEVDQLGSIDYADNATSSLAITRALSEAIDVGEPITLPAESGLAPVLLPAAGTREATDLTARLRYRLRHIISENQRVRLAVRALKSGDIAAIGPLLSDSHASLRDNFEVSSAELDVAAAVAEEAGALGARMMGGGFGGSVIALTPANTVRAVAGHVIRSFVQRGWTKPAIRTVHPAPGAHRDR